MLKGALCGNYVNFGVFRLYGDNALDKALNMFIKLMVSIPLKNLLVRIVGQGHACCINVFETITNLSTLEPLAIHINFVGFVRQ